MRGGGVRRALPRRAPALQRCRSKPAAPHIPRGPCRRRPQDLCAGPARRVLGRRRGSTAWMGSCFPTPTGVNPMITCGCVRLRTADAARPPTGSGTLVACSRGPCCVAASIQAPLPATPPRAPQHRGDQLHAQPTAGGGADGTARQRINQAATAGGGGGGGGRRRRLQAVTWLAAAVSLGIMVAPVDMEQRPVLTEMRAKVLALHEARHVLRANSAPV